MAWHTGKTAIAVASIGDSNCVAFQYDADFNPPGGQSANADLYCYTSASGQVPYSESNLGYRNLDPNAANRLAELTSSESVGDTTFIGQLLGGNGNSAMQLASTVQQGTGIDTYLYQAAKNGTFFSQWAAGVGWSTLARTVPAALAAIPGSPTYFDIIYLSLGTNDVYWGVSAEAYCQAAAEFRRRMIAAGWWVPGATQIVMMDLPRNALMADKGYPESWFGLARVVAGFNDKIAMVSSIGRDIQTSPFQVHYTPQAHTAMGEESGEMVLAGIPRRRPLLSVGGSRLSFGGAQLRAHG
jgi:hypothetical protein